MGSSQSIHNIPFSQKIDNIKDNISEKIRGKITNDPCSQYMDEYLNCVNNHSKGLTEGDDCSEEVKNYKACRSKQKLLKQQQNNKENN
jgi:hypothetical protein